MAIFYILAPDRQIYELSATTEVAVSYRGSPTRHKVEDGSTITDNYVIENTTASFSGVITYIRMYNAEADYKNPKDYIEGLVALMRSKQVFTVYTDNKLSPINNCLFTEIAINKDVEAGLSSWLCRMSFEQIRIEQRARASKLSVAPTTESANTVADKEDVGNTQGKDPRTLSLIRKGGQSVSDVFSPKKEGGD